MIRHIVVGLALVAGLSACNTDQSAAHHNEVQPGSLVAHLNPTAGNEGIQGQVMFHQSGDKVQVTVHIEGLPSNSTHGFHVHEYGDCSAPNGTSAGGHFNPSNMNHGAPHDAKRHVGDLGNLESNNAGTVHFEAADSHLAMSGAHSIVGRAVIVHAQADDLTSQPVGNAGARVLCGVIGVAKEL